MQQRVFVDENAPVVKVVNLILEAAVRARASDVHIEPQKDRLRIRARTDGVLHEILTMPPSMGPSLISRIKVMADMNIIERRRSQDGQLEIMVGGRRLDVRVSTAATVLGEKCVLRLLDGSRAFIGLEQLGMLDNTFADYSELIRSPFGMVICAGPTGSGKTTTLYATLSAINHDGINIVTIEDPVEYLFPSINQIQTNEQAGVTFANGLRSILRQDPDAILVGEIRDVETARIAVQAALTGHFVMSSLHATDAPAALQRFMDMGLEAFLIASSLLGVVGQRLIRRVCPHCVEPYTPTPDEMAFYESSGGDPNKSVFIHGAGCNFCGNTGYFERIGVYEVLRITDTMRRAIVEKASHEELRDDRGRARDEDAARPGRPTRRGRQDHHRRGPPHGLRALGNRGPRCRTTNIEQPMRPERSVKANADSHNERELRDALLLQNLDVTHIKVQRRLSDIEIGKKRIPPMEIMQFSRQMATFVRAGISIPEGLDIIIESTSSKRFQEILQRGQRGDRSRRSLLGRRSPNTRTCSRRTYIGLCRAGELTGRIDTVLEQLADYVERDLDARSKVKSALTYPAIVMGMSVVTVAVLLIGRAAQVHEVLQGVPHQAPARRREC